MSFARLIINPAAGAGKGARAWPQIAARLKELGLPFEHDFTEAPGHALELARSAAGNGCDLMVAVGGDGTINEIVNGLYQSGRLPEVKLGIISIGTGCDCIRTLGIPRDPEQACRRLIGPGTVTLDVGVAEYRNAGRPVQRLFLNNAGLGLDAAVARTTTRKLKLLGSKASYQIGVLATVLRYKNREVSLDIDGKTHRGKVCMVVASNLKYLGGGMRFAPDADPADGLLDVSIIGDMSKAELLWRFPQVYKGTHTSLPRVSVRKAREIRIEAAAGIFIEIDGELVGTPPARFGVLPTALNVVV